MKDFSSRIITTYPSLLLDYEILGDPAAIRLDSYLMRSLFPITGYIRVVCFAYSCVVVR